MMVSDGNAASSVTVVHEVKIFSAVNCSCLSCLYEPALTFSYLKKKSDSLAVFHILFYPVHDRGVAVVL